MKVATGSDKEAQVLLRSLIYEEMDGEPLYYQGYRQVLDHQKTLDDIMGSSSLQATIIRLLLKYLYTNVDGKGFKVYTNEAGLHLAKGNNLASDIMIYSESALKSYRINKQYFTIPPQVVIEVDIKVDLSFSDREAYVKEKTKKLFRFGAARVIWILSATQQIIMAEPNQDWLIRDWNLPFAIMADHTVNIGEMLKGENTDQDH